MSEGIKEEIIMDKWRAVNDVLFVIFVIAAVVVLTFGMVVGSLVFWGVLPEGFLGFSTIESK